MNVLITGGASGLGEAITRKLAQIPGSTIYFTYSRSQANAKKLESELSNSKAIKCDFRSQVDLNALKAQIESLNLSVLINNAYCGEPIKSYFHKIDPADFLTEFKDNIVPTVEITQSALSSFKKKKEGKIITILTAFLADNPPIGTAVYVANKAYLKKLTQVWATENVKFNITSNSISPSFMLTGFTSGVDSRLVEQMIADHPLKKLLTVEEVAETAHFLTVSSSHINGVDIILNSATSIK
jgi:3-oxoacyl-[acyl-carrier protein] reductase